MTRIKFLKQHLNHKKDDIVPVDDTQAHYLVRMGVVEYADNNPKVKENTLLQHLEDTKENKNQSKTLKAAKKKKA